MQHILTNMFLKRKKICFRNIKQLLQLPEPETSPNDYKNMDTLAHHHAHGVSLWCWKRAELTQQECQHASTLAQPAAAAAAASRQHCKTAAHYMTHIAA